MIDYKMFDLGNRIFCKILLMTFSFVLFFLGLFFNVKNITLCSVLVIFIYNLISSFIEKKDGFCYFILFHLFIFLFILSRPSIAMLRGDNWWYFDTYTINTSLFILLLALVFLNIGFNLSKQKKIASMKCDKIIIGDLRKVILILVIITLLASFIKETLIFLAFRGNYVGIYVANNVNNVPKLIEFLSNFSLYLLIIYLATLPRKKSCYIILSLYLLTGIPGLMVGGRNALMIKALFCFVYFLLRNVLDKKELWIGKKEKISIAFMIPILIVTLGIMNYTRVNSDVPLESPIALGLDFFYKQGTSYDTLCQSIENRAALRDNNYINYTFGEPIDFIIHNKLSNIVFDTEHLDEGNSIFNATQSNNLAHRLSYIVLGDTYLSGHGRGTTYFSEIYLDFGYLGIAVFNFLIGYLFTKVNALFSRGLFTRIILLNSLMLLFMIPRLAFFSIFTYFTNYYFWLSVIILLILVYFGERYRKVSI